MFVVLLFLLLLLWKVQPDRIIWAGLLGGLLWAMFETMNVYKALTNMKKLISPFKLSITLKETIRNSMTTFVLRGMLFYAVNYAMTVSNVPLWSHVMGLSFGFYVALAFVVSYHKAKMFIK